MGAARPLPQLFCEQDHMSRMTLGDQCLQWSYVGTSGGIDVVAAKVVKLFLKPEG